jgi:hypothetical protein
LKLQQRAQRLKAENDKLKTVLEQSFGIDRTKIDEQDPATLVQEITEKFAVNELNGQAQVAINSPNRTPLSGAVEFSCTISALEFRLLIVQ